MAARQQITRDWWSTGANRFELFVPEAVLQEIRAGDAEAAGRRPRVIEGLPILIVDDNVRSLAHIYRDRLKLPERAEADALHIALAVYYEVDYLVTWNCAPIANGQVIRRLIP